MVSFATNTQVDMRDVIRGYKMSVIIQVKSVSEFLSAATTMGICPECGGNGSVLRARNSKPYFWCRKCKKIIKDITLKDSA